MKKEEILIERKGFIGYVTLNRPEKLNSITWSMYDLISDAMDELEDDDNIRVIVFRGEGRAFSAGFDLNEPGLTDHLDLRKRYERVAQASRIKVWNNLKPTIAQIHGYCLGAAHDLALACDIAIATENSKLGVPEIQFGGGTPFLLMPWTIGLRKTKEILLTGKSISGKYAEEIGLVNYAVADEDLDSKVLEIASELARVPAPAIQLQKRGINRAIEISGFSAAAESWLDLSSLGTLWRTPEVDEFNRIVSEKGPKAAIQWQNDRLKNLIEQ